MLEARGPSLAQPSSQSPPQGAAMEVKPSWHGSDSPATQVPAQLPPVPADGQDITEHSHLAVPFLNL